MRTFELAPLVRDREEKIVLFVLGGIGGLQSGPNMLTELQQSHRPHLNALARKSACGLLQAIAPGITPEPGAALRRLLGWRGETPLDLRAALHLRGTIISASSASRETGQRSGLTAVACGEEPEALMEAVCSALADSDLLIAHFGQPEQCGLAGGYYEKIRTIEEFDQTLAQINAHAPAVMAVCGDHSCPSAAAAITWHPVPLMIHARSARYDLVQTFDEIACATGSLGHLVADQLLPLLLAHAGRLAPAL